MFARYFDVRFQEIAGKFRIAGCASIENLEVLPGCRIKARTQARSAIISWKEDYNHHRPYSALGNMPPAEFAMKSTLEKQAA